MSKVMKNIDRSWSKDKYVATGETYGPVDSPIYKKNGKKYIKITSGRDVRYLLLPENREGSNEPGTNVYCTQLMQEDWNKIVDKTKYPTMQQRKVLADEYLRGQVAKQEEVLHRKMEMQKAMESAEKTRKLNPVEREREYKRKYTLDRAKQLLLDQEDQVKSFNTMLAMKKCIATWDLQILEKEKIKEELKQEKSQFEKQEELKMKKLLKNDETERQKEKAERQNFINALGEQIKEREYSMKLQMEMKQLERNRFNKAARQAEIDELEAYQKKTKANEKVREEQRRVNVLIQRLQAIDKEEDRLFFEKQRHSSDERQKEIEKGEAEKREIEAKRKEELQKMADEKLKAEERAKFQDLMDEVLRLDNVERTWRQRELMEKQEKQKGLDEMYAQLETQVEGRRITKAQVIEEERREVCKVAKDNIEDEEKDRAAERKIKLANEQQRLEILMQINDIDRRKLVDREERMMESSFYKIQEERRVERAKEAMWARIEQARKDGLPENYVLDLEKFVTENYGPRTVSEHKPK